MQARLSAKRRDVLVAAWHHSHCLLEEPVFPSTRPPVVMVALIERRIWTPLDYRSDHHHAGTIQTPYGKDIDIFRDEA